MNVVDTYSQTEAWVLARFLELGFTLSQGENLLMVNADWHEADRLIKAGMTPEQAYQQLI